MIKNTTGVKDKKCYMCDNGLSDVDFKDGQLLRKFISSYSKIMPKRRTKLCSKHQRKIAMAIKRARIMAVLPFINR